MTRDEGNHGGSDHDDEESSGGEEGEVRSDAQRTGQDQAERTKDFADPDESKEWDRQRRLYRKRGRREDELRHPREDEDQGEYSAWATHSILLVLDIVIPLRSSGPRARANATASAPYTLNLHCTPYLSVRLPQ